MFQIPVNLILSNYEEYQQIRDCAELSINHQKCCMTKALPTITVLYLYEIFYRQNSIKLKLEWRISSLFIWNFNSRTYSTELGSSCNSLSFKSQSVGLTLNLRSLVTSDQDLLTTDILLAEHFKRNHHRYRSCTTAPSQRTSPYQIHSEYQELI